MSTKNCGLALDAPVARRRAEFDRSAVRPMWSHPTEGDSRRMERPRGGSWDGAREQSLPRPCCVSMESWLVAYPKGT